MTTNQHEALSVATAVSLYLHNIDPSTVAQKIFGHFEGECMSLENLTEFFLSKNRRRVYWATDLSAPTADILIKHACAKYLEEARRRVSANLKQQ